MGLYLSKAVSLLNQTGYYVHLSDVEEQPTQHVEEAKGNTTEHCILHSYCLFSMGTVGSSCEFNSFQLDNQ